MQFEVLRMKGTDEQVKNDLRELVPFLGSMYTDQDERLHGELAFQMDSFLFLWDNGGVFLLLGRNDNRELQMVAVCSQYRDLWTGVTRVEIQRVAMLQGLDSQTEIDKMVKYLKGVSSLLKFKQLYYCEQYEDGTIVKRLVHNEVKT